MDLSTINLDNFTKQEREAVCKILKEMSDKGSSKSLDELRYADYKEIPVDIITFIKDYNYLGKAWHLPDGTCKLYPYWEEKLKELFPDNISTSVNNYILSGARGLGKSEIAITIMLYIMYRVMCLKNPHEHFNLKPTEKIAFSFMNITEALAMDIGISKFQNTVQMSPWFMSKGTLSGNKEQIWNPPSYIKIIIGSQPRHVIGQATLASFFDEISFIPTQSIEKQKARAIDMIDTAVGGMKTRFTHKGKNPGIVILASSKRSDKSFLEQHMKKKAVSEGDNTIIIDEAVWNIKPKGTYSDKIFHVAVGNRFLASEIVPDGITDLTSYRDKGYRIINVPSDLKPDFVEDIDRALCDFAGISSSELTTYISGIRFSQCKTNKYQNPFVKDIIEVGNSPDDTSQYWDFFDLSRVPQELKYKPLFIHLDMSISGDKTGIAGTWIKGKKVTQEGQPSSKDLMFQAAFSVSVKAPKGFQVSFEKNRQFIRWLRDNGFNIKLVTSDTFQSYDLQQQLKAEHFNTDILSVDRVNTDHICVPYQYFKSTIYEQRLIIYEKCDLLTNEVVSLERNNNTGKVDHPDHGCFTGDTKISLVDGREVTIDDLMLEQQYKTNWVYTVNETTKLIEPKPIKKVFQTKVVKELLRITLDNGEYFECTPDHRLMLLNGSYMEAQYVEENTAFRSFNKTPYKVKNIKTIHKNCPVYDLEIQDNHNFALSAGIFVHNSKDVSDALCGSIYDASKYADQYSFEYGDDIDNITQISNNSIYNQDAQDIANEMENNLKQYFRKDKQHQSTSDKAKQMDFGFGPAEPAYSLVSEGIIVL